MKRGLANCFTILKVAMHFGFFRTAKRPPEKWHTLPQPGGCLGHKDLYPVQLPNFGKKMKTFSSVLRPQVLFLAEKHFENEMQKK